jgi:X-X-X-Leu-X-X-Gly heptad repeat protein
MGSSAKEMTSKFKDDIVEPVAKGAAASTKKIAKGSEKFAKGSEALADGARKMADKTQDWADDVTGTNRRRNLILVAVILTIIAAVVGMLVQSDS